MVGLPLRDRLKLDLDGIFECDHVGGGRVDELQERVERRCLARNRWGRTSPESPGAWSSQLATLAWMARSSRAPRRRSRLWPSRMRSTIFSPCEHGNVDARRWMRPTGPGSSVNCPSCGYAPLGDVHSREHLDARDDLARNFGSDDALLGHRAVDAKANLEVVALGLEVDVARPVSARRGAPARRGRRRHRLRWGVSGRAGRNEIAHESGGENILRVREGAHASTMLRLR